MRSGWPGGRATAASEMAALSQVWAETERVARERAHERSGGRIPVAPSDAPGGAPAPLPPVPDHKLTDFEKRRAARIAVAEVQKHHAAWAMAHLRFEIHRALPPGVSEADVTEIASLVASGRAGADVVQIGAAADIADVTPPGGAQVGRGQRVPAAVRPSCGAPSIISTWKSTSSPRPRRRAVGWSPRRGPGSRSPGPA